MPEILTDGVHLVCRDLNTLHAFARRLGFRRAWFQDGRHPHYDLTTRRALKRAIAAGAHMATRRDILHATELLRESLNA